MSSTVSALRGWVTDGARVVVVTYRNWRRTRTIRLGAGIAYYALFALVPLLSLSLFVAQILVDPLKVEQFFVEGMEQLGTSEEAAQELTSAVDSLGVQRGLGIVGLVSLLFAAGLVFVALQDAFDEIWDVPVEAGITRSIRRRLLAFAVVGGGGIVIVLLLVVNSVTTVLQDLIPGSDNILHRLGTVVGFLSSWVVMMVALGVVFQVLTQVHIRLLALTIGTLATGALLAAGTSLLGVYLSEYAGESFTGAAAGVLLTLLWLYYVAQMLLVGLHLTRVVHEVQNGDLDLLATEGDAEGEPQAAATASPADVQPAQAGSD